MIYVFRDGRLVEKEGFRAKTRGLPYISRLEPYESPITGKEITSWRQRDMDLKTSDSVDPRDLPRKPFEDRKKRYG